MAKKTVAQLDKEFAELKELVVGIKDSVKLLIEAPALPARQAAPSSREPGQVNIPQFRVQNGTFYATGNVVLPNGKSVTGYMNWSDSRRLTGGLPSSKGNHVLFIRAFEAEAAARGFVSLSEDLGKYADHSGV